MIFKENANTVKIKITVKLINKHFSAATGKWLNSCETVTFPAFIEVNYTRIEEMKSMPLENIINKFYEEFQIDDFLKIPYKSPSNELYFLLVPKSNIISIKIEKG